MPQAGYTIGRDIAFDVMTSYGPLRIPKVTKFTKKPGINQIKIVLLTGNVDTLQVPDGWSGTIECERAGATLDNFWAQWEDDYYNGIDQGKATITETITEPDGSVSVFRYEQVQLHLTDAGDAEGDKNVKQSLAWTSRRRKKVG
jgi:hypothetical protein